MADEGISAGSVFVEVTPRSTGFWAKFVAENSGGAAKAGDDLGDRIGKAISARIAKGVRDGLDGGGVRAQGVKQGNEFGGTFADTARRRIEAALRSLPTAQIGVATTEAEQKLKDLRGELSTLAGKKIGVDIGAAEALTEVRRLKAALDELAQKSPDVQVRVDAANAAIELAAVDREVSRLDGRRADVNVNTNADLAASRFQLLVNAGLALGPAIVPGAAAAAAAILGIGVAAVSVVSALGVGILAFRGVGGAVKALGDAQQASAKTGNTLVQQQQSLASSADQVRSAEASLANTRASAGDAQRRSLQQIADAERQVGQAQREAQRAQDALNASRDEERRSQQDTAFQLRQNVIDQKRAAAEVAAARQAALGGGEPAKLALDEALLRQEELKVAGDRLTAEQQRNTQTGIDGSKRVVAAQDAVVSAQQRVADAERGVSQAREQAASQARQSAFAIAQAQQAVISAQRAAGAATVAAAATGGAAVDKLNDALKNLPVSSQTFARFIFGLKPTLLDLQAAAADGLLPGAQASIETLLPYVGNLRGFIGNVAGEMGVLAQRSATALTAPFWRQFFGFIGDQAVPTMDALFEASGNVAEGGARIIQAFGPLERQVGGGFVTLTQRFLEFSQGIDRNQGFQRFLQYAAVEGPHVVATIGELAKVGLRVVEAYGPVGSVVVSELRILGQIINAIPVPVITALAFAITSYKTASFLASGAQSLLNSGLLTGIGRMITYKTVTDAAGVATTGVQRALSATSGFIGGPFLLAVTAAATVIGLLAQRQAEAKAETDSYRSTLEDYARTFKDGVTPAALESAKAILANNVALRGLVEITQSHDISAAEVVAGLNGEAGAREKVIAAIDDHIGALALKAAIENGDAAKADLAQIKSLDKMRQAFLDAGANAAEAGRLTGQLAQEQSKATGLFDQATPSVKSLADAYRTMADATSTAADKANALKQAEDLLFGAARTRDQAVEDQAKALRNTNKALDDRNLLNEDGAKQLDVNTEAGTRLRDNLKDQLSAINATFRANVANGESIDKATKAHDDEVAKLKASAIQHGLNADAVQHLIDIYGLVPPSASTDVKVTGLDTTKAQLDELLVYQYALRNGITVTEARGKLHPDVASAGGKGQSRSGFLATGGPVVGPGTGTSDDVPAVERSTGARFQLSNGEFVQPTASVDYYGQGFMEALRRRAIPKQAVRGYASGGLIDQILTDHYPYPTTTAMTQIPTRAQVAAALASQITGGSAGPWPSSPSAQRGDSGVWRSVVALIRSTGPLSGEFGNAYRPGDPLWHGSGRAVDWMGYNQDALATFLAQRNPLELIHRSRTRDYAYTRGRDKGSFNNALMEAHRNHVHIAMRDGGVVGSAGSRLPFGVFDSGGHLPPGLSLAYNGTGRPEVIRTEAQEQALAAPSHTWNIHGSEGQSVYELAHAVSAEVMWQGGL